MKITSITIDTDYVYDAPSSTYGGAYTSGPIESTSRLLIKSTRIRRTMDGEIGIASFAILDENAHINTIACGKEVIAYSGTLKIFGGYIAKITRQKKFSNTHSVALLECQDYSILLDAAIVTADEVHDATSDEVVLDALFSKYLSAVSTTPVFEVEAALSITIPAGTTLREAVQLITERTGANWYIDPEKQLQYFEPSDLDSNDVPFVIREEMSSFSTSSLSVTSGTYNENTKKLTEAAAGPDAHALQANCTYPPGIDGSVTLTAKVKPAERTLCYLGTVPGHVWFDLSSQEVLTISGVAVSANIFRLEDGWFQLVVRCIVTPDSATQWICGAATTDGITTYVGDGSSGIYIDRESMTIQSGLQCLGEALSHIDDFATKTNAVTVLGAPPKTTSDVTTLTMIGAAVDSASVRSAGDTSWPPAGGGDTVDASSAFSFSNGEFASGNYWKSVFCFRVDTSGIPDAATITSARLRIRTATAPSSSTADDQIGIEYYSSANWPITTADYTGTGSDTAAAFANRSLSAGAYHEFQLQNLGSISKTGFTGFRMHYNSLASPPDHHYNPSFSDAQSLEIQLIVTYNEVTSTDQIFGSASDQGSIDAHGQWSRTITDQSIVTAEEANLRAEAEVAKYANPLRYGSFEIRTDGLLPGSLVDIDWDSLEVNDNFLVRVVEMTWPANVEQTHYRVEYGEHRPDLSRFLAKLANRP